MSLTIADFTGLPAPINRLVIMPQWDFLNFLADQGRADPHFTLLMRTAATGLIEGGNRVAGVTVEGPDGPFAIEADVVVACDGRRSTIRAATGMKPIDIGAPMDVLWFALPRRADDAAVTGGTFAAGAIFVMIDRGDVWQCGYVIGKGGEAQIRAEGLEAFRARIGELVPRAARPPRCDPLALRREAADGRRRPARDMAQAGPAADRRRRAYDVAGRRRRHQSRGAGCGRRGEHPRAGAAQSARRRTTISPPCRRAANFPRRRRRPRRCSSRTTSSRGFCAGAARSPMRR